jgi:hypothetical protein
MNAGSRYVATHDIFHHSGSGEIIALAGTKLICTGPSGNALHPIGVMRDDDPSIRFAVSNREVTKLNNYPASPGFKERGGTSQAAGEEMQVTAETVRELVLAEIERKPGTADEVAARLGLSILTVRPRLSELKVLGKIRKSTARRRNESGKLAVVWLFGGKTEDIEL